MFTLKKMSLNLENIQLGYILLDTVVAAAALFTLKSYNPPWDNVGADLLVATAAGYAVDMLIWGAPVPVMLLHSILGGFFGWFFFPQFLEIGVTILLWIYSHW